MTNWLMQGADVTVSVVIPCYNVSSLVEEAVASAVAQTVTPLEIICVDDGSTDDTLAVLRRLEEAHAPLVRVVAQANGGAPSARNNGLRQAQGTYIQFLDADDALPPQKMERHIRMVTEAPAPPDLIAASYDLETEPGTCHTVRVDPDRDLWVSLITSQIGNTCSNLWRKAFLEQVNGWNEAQKSSQEAELMFRMLQHDARVLVDPEPAITIIKREGSISTANRTAFIERNIALRHGMRQYLETMPRHHTPERVQAINERLFSNLVALFERNPEKARALASSVLPSGFVPPRRALYRLVYRVLGFSAAQRWQEAYGRLRDALGASTR